MNQVYAYTSRRARTVPQLATALTSYNMLTRVTKERNTREDIHSNVRTGKEECGGGGRGTAGRRNSQTIEL